MSAVTDSQISDSQDTSFRENDIDCSQFTVAECFFLESAKDTWESLLARPSTLRFANVVGEKPERLRPKVSYHAERMRKVRESEEKTPTVRIRGRWHTKLDERWLPLLDYEEVPLFLCRLWLGHLTDKRINGVKPFTERARSMYGGFSRDDARSIFASLERTACQSSTGPGHDQRDPGADSNIRTGLTLPYVGRVTDALSQFEYQIQADSAPALADFRSQLVERQAQLDKNTMFDARLDQMLQLLGNGPDWPWGSFDTKCSSVSQCDYIVTTQEDISNHIESRQELRTLPHVVRQAFRTDSCSVERFLDTLELRAGSIPVDIQDHSKARSTNRTSLHKAITVPELRQRIGKRSNLDFLSSENLPVNLLNIHGNDLKFVQAVPSLARFQGLTLSHQWTYSYQHGVGKGSYRPGHDEAESFMAACSSFELLGLRGAYSGPHVDVLGATEISCHSGLKAWLTYTAQAGQEGLLEEFGKNGDGWSPKDLFKLILLRPGDHILMPPGAMIIHAPITIDDCLMSGRMFIDIHQLPWLSKHILFLINNPAMTNETLASDFDHIWENLMVNVKRNMDKFKIGDPTEFLEKLEKADQELRQRLTCDCPRASNRRGPPNCPCRSLTLLEGRCSIWCSCKQNCRARCG